MDQSKIVLLFHTVKYLRFKQIYYRLYYALRSHFSYFKMGGIVEYTSSQLHWGLDLSTSNSYNNKVFTFLNLDYKFDRIDWNYFEFGKLWTYNLNYFDFLNQQNISKEEGLVLIEDYIFNEATLKDGLEPYPTSLRVINWIKFISKHQIRDEKIDAVLYNHLKLLSRTLEHHLLGNHLLENAFALLFGSYYFDDEKLYKKAKNLLEAELNEQILNDGAHFELSPMYHKILLTKVLDCINLVENNSWKEDDLLITLKEKAGRMLGWLKMITFKNGHTPMVNDSSFDIAPSIDTVFDYAQYLKLKTQNSKLSDSGYRKWIFSDMEVFMDVSQIGPDYIPGHAHADTFNFELHYKGIPIIVDTGISTYEKNARRQLERSTESHNTIRIDEKDSSEVWDGFRVAKRAKIISLQESEDTIEATHDGYESIGVHHTRIFKKIDNTLVIDDKIDSKNTYLLESFLHFHPNCSVTINGSCIEIDSELVINITNANKISLEEYDYSLGFNKSTKAKKIRAFVLQDSRITITSIA